MTSKGGLERKTMKKLLSILLILFGVTGLVYLQEKPKTEQAKILRAIDGDSLSVQIGDKFEVVRLIGVDSPELKDNRALVKCFAQEAKKNAETLAGKVVRLESDPTQSDKDHYGRLLRYVYWDDTNLNEWIIKNGFAYEYTYRKPYKYQKEFKEAQKHAEKYSLGLWGATCG